jgi:nucleotide-binding universal stress UspA family protein
MQHVLLATDGSGGADRAADVAAKLVKSMGGRLSILTVGGNLSGDEMKQLARAEGDAAMRLMRCRSKSWRTPSKMRSAQASPMSKSMLDGAIRRR